MMSEWMAATPFTALLPTTAKYAMFTSLQEGTPAHTVLSDSVWPVPPTFGSALASLSHVSMLGVFVVNACAHPSSRLYLAS